MPQAIPWVVGRGWEGAREAMARHEADDVCALVERDTSRVTCTLGEAIWPLCVLANVTGRGTAAGLGAHLLCPSQTLMATQPGAHSPLSARDSILPPPFPDVSLTFSSSLPEFSCILLQFGWVSSGLGDSTRSLCSCDQPLPSPFPHTKRLVVRGAVHNKPAEANSWYPHCPFLQSSHSPFSKQSCTVPVTGML